MTTAEDIEKAVEKLAPRELARFRAWFEAFDALQFDAAIERDINAGKLDSHAEEALAGRSRFVSHSASPKFWTAFEALPLPVRNV
jgi:hypothetical protein